jgi:hypothetical protein
LTESGITWERKNLKRKGIKRKDSHGNPHEPFEMYYNLVYELSIAEMLKGED